jgi:hypothetical protein
MGYGIDYGELALCEMEREMERLRNARCLEARGKEHNMVSLSWWEQFIIGAAVSFLTVLASKITNPVELAALQAAIAFLQKLLGGQVALA